MNSTNHHPHHADFPKLKEASIVFCPATARCAPQPHHMMTSETHIYFDADSPECQGCAHIGGCKSKIQEASFSEEASQLV